MSRADSPVNVREAPAYTLADGARYLRLPPATLRAWVVGRDYKTAEGAKDFSPLILPASTKPTMLSFANLIEAHVLRGLRSEHGVSVKALRAALAYAQQTLGIERLLLSAELRTEAGAVLLDRYGELINLSASGQLAMRELLEGHLKRIDWDDARLPIRLYPFVSAVESGQARPIAIDPRISFGRPVILRNGVSTATVAGRLDAGEPIEGVAADYDLDPSEVMQAAVYEHAA